MERFVPPPSFRLGALPHFPEGGGPVLFACDKAFETWAGKALAACSNDRQGRLVLDTDADARWVARRGDTDVDHTPDLWWTGRARHGDTFHFGAWEDGSVVVALTHQRTLLAHPVVFRMPQRLDLGPMGKNWSFAWMKGSGVLDTVRWHNIASQHSLSTIGCVFPDIATERLPDVPHWSRAAAVVRASLLQTLSDLAHAIPGQPPVLWPVTRLPRSGWTVPPFGLTGAPAHTQAGYAPKIRAALFPTVARAFVAKHLTAEHTPFSVEVQPARMTGNGAMAPPSLYVPDDIQRIFPSRADGKRFAKDLVDAFDAALMRGELGPMLAWRHEGGNTLRVTFDPSQFSRHAILAALAPPHRPVRAQPPTPDAGTPWWAEMAGDDV